MIPTYSLIEHLNEIERQLRISEAPIPPNIPEQGRQAKLKNKENAGKAVKRLQRELLQEFDTEKELQDLLNEIFEGMLQRSQAQLSLAPREDHPQYGTHYNKTLIQYLVPLCTLAYACEGKAGDPLAHALKLSLVFDDVPAVYKYLLDNGNYPNPMRDSCLFILPDVRQCTFEVWKKHFQTNANNEYFRKHLFVHASALEKQLLDRETPKGENPRWGKNREHLKAKKKEISDKNSRLRELERTEDLSDEEEKEYQELLVLVSQLHLELFDLSAGLKLNEADIHILTAAHEALLHKAHGTYAYFLKQGLNKKDHLKFIGLDRSKAGKNIPDIMIDGEVLGYPGFYLMKVPVMDEDHAARAACFGRLTDCCQSLSGEAGEPCVVYGLTSPDSGFYVLCQGDSKAPSVDDPVIAQSWIWRSKNNAIVLDSAERTAESIEPPPDELASRYKHAIDLVPIIALSFYEKLAEELVNNQYTDKVVIGSRSGISSKLGEEHFMNETEYPIDYNGYRDSHFQRVLSDKNYPFLRDSEQHYFEKIKPKLQEIMTSSSSLRESVFFKKFINWILITQRNDLGLISEFINQLQEQDQHQVLLAEFNKITTATCNFIRIKEESSNKDLEEVIKDIREGIILVDTQNNTGLSPLALAAKTNSFQAVTELIELRADVNLRSEDGRSPLHWACEKGNSEVALLLIKQGADSNAQDKKYRTPILDAVAQGHLQTVQALIEFGVDSNSTNDLEMTPVMEACKEQRIDILAYLLQQGADPNLLSYSGKTAMDYALKSRNSQAIQLLLQNGVVKPDITTLIMTNNFELAIESLEELQTLNQNTLGELFNHCLEFKGNEQKVRSEDLALALYERLNPPGVDTHNLYLNRAIQYRKKAIAEKIIAMEKDIKPNQTLMLGHSLLQGAIYARWTDIAACLIDKGADINWIDSSMITPLKSAASGGDLELVKKIVAKGGNILFSEKRMPGVWRMPGHNYNRTALSFAAANGHVAVAQFLLEQEPKLPLDEPLWQACSNGQYEMANLLLDKGASAEKVSVHPLIKQKQYALAIRCIEAKATLPGYFGHEFSDPEADSWLLSLIKNGADVHWVSLDCETSLMLAAKKGNPNIVEALMSKGVDGSKIDKCGNNALHHALNAQADAKIVALLLEYGVDPNQPNKQGLTPIELAEQKGLQDLCDLFAQQGSLNKHAAA